MSAEGASQGSKQPDRGSNHQSTRGRNVASTQGGGDASVDASTHIDLSTHYHGTRWPSGPPVQRLRRVDGFLGRDAELSRVLESLSSGSAVTLYGPGGMGKSALAAEVLHALAPEGDAPAAFPGGILVHTFYDQPRVDVALEGFALALGEESKPDPVSAARRALAGRRVLLVIDGAERADDLPKLLSVGEDCGVLITTRDRTDARGDLVVLEPLAPEESDSLLSDSMGGGADAATGRRICALLGELPLAVRLAGSYMASHGVAADEYLAWLTATPLDALDHGARSRESVPVLMERSVAALSDDARFALSVTGVLAMAPFDRDPLLAAWDAWEQPMRATVALGELVQFGLLQRHDNGSWEVTHALVHTFARDRLDLEAATATTLGSWLARAASTDTVRPGWDRIEAMIAHALSLLDVCRRMQSWPHVSELALAWENVLDLRGKSEERSYVCRTALEAARIAGDREGECNWLTFLGVCQWSRGLIAPALESHGAALAVSREIGNVRGEARALGNLGLCYQSTQRYDEALESAREALTIFREVGDRHGEAYSLGSIGICLRRTGRVEEAIEAHEESLRVARAIGDRRSEGNELGNLGNCYHVQDQLEEAVEAYEGVLVIARALGDRRTESTSLGNLGICHAKLGRLDDAIAAYQSALEIARETGDRNGEGNHGWNLGMLIGSTDPDRAVELMSVRVDYFREIGHPDAETCAEHVDRLRQEPPG